MVIADNINVEGQGGQFIRVPDNDDTFKLRELADGTHYRVIKNYLTRFDFDGLLAGQRDIEYHSG